MGIFGNKYIIIGIILAAVFGSGLLYINILKSKVSGLTDKNEALTALLGVSQASVKNLQSSLDEQNIAVEKLKADADERELASRAAIAKAQAQAAAAKQHANTLISIKIPDGKTACDAANDLFNSEIKNAK